MVVRNVRHNPVALLEMLEALRQGAQGSSYITVRILAAADHDGVCATKILVTVLQRAGVKYTVVPVTTNTEIIEHLRQLEEDTEVRSLVLLNCGASLDLESQLEECAAPDEIMCFVIDAHRPFLLANLSERHKRVVVLDDDPIGEASNTRPPVDEEDDGPSQLTQDAEGSDSDNEKENVFEPALAEGGEPRLGREERKRRREEERQARQAKKRQKINEYYTTSYCAAPAALSLFKLAKQAATPSQDLLWLAAVALMGYHDQGLWSEMPYQRCLQEELKESNDRTAESFFSESAASGTMPDAASDDEDPPASRRPPLRRSHEKLSLRFEKDLRLTLYKHWGLEDSMMHSSYFYGMFGLHRDKGLRSLKNFFATAGIPPNDYRQIFSCMQMKNQKSIASKFRTYGKAYGLSENKMFLEQCVRDLGPLGEMYRALYLNEISCSDAVHVVSALLSVVPPELSGANQESLPQDAGGRRDRAAINEMERQAMVANFWRAFDTVLCKEPTTLRDGIQEAVEVAKAVQVQGRLIRDTKAMHKTGGFYWCKIEQPPHLFRHHLAVRRLAVWLLHVVYTYRAENSSNEKPLLVIVRDKVRDTYLCVGATPTRYSDRDEFGNLFRGVLRRDPTLKFRYDFFDKSCIEIAADDFDRFWELMSSD
uniref:Cell division control protein 45 n=1 Tax=Alexandrium catenella TaxID=2925 RepID=A0A7S1S361_ALECA